MPYVKGSYSENIKLFIDEQDNTVSLYVSSCVLKEKRYPAVGTEIEQCSSASRNVGFKRLYTKG